MDSNQQDKTHYINSLISYDCEFTAYYDKIEKSRHYVDLQPAITKGAGKLLSLLVRLINAKQVLEIGTAVGYSSHWIVSGLQKTGGHLITIDNHQRTSKEALQNFENSKIDDYVEFINEDAQDVLPALASNYFDIVFLDCSKALYTPLYNQIYRILKKGGLFVIDDTLISFQSTVRDSLKKSVEFFNATLAKDGNYYSTVVDIGHGLTLAIKEGD